MADAPAGSTSGAKGFDPEAFYNSLLATVKARSVTWKQVSTDTGVSPTTLTRMAQGRSPDAASLASLSAWAGLNPADYVTMTAKARRPEALAAIATILHSDPNLGADAARTLDAMIQAAYKGLKSKK